MNKWPIFAALLFILSVASVPAGTIEDWSNVSGGNTGTFADDTGSKISYEVTDGAKGKAVKMQSELKEGGWCGIWHNVTLSCPKANALKFMAKAASPSQLSLSLTDANKVQYVTTVQISSKDWAEVTVPITAFEKNKYYTPEGAVLGKPMDLSNVPGIGLSPGAPGTSTLWVGAITYTEGAAPAASTSSAAAPAEAKPAASTPAKGTSVVLQDFGFDDPKIGGAWKDDKGTKIDLSYKPAKKKENADDKALVVHYNLIQGGWCGFWYRAGDDPSWTGVDCSNGKAIVMKVYTSKPAEIGISLEDGSKLKFEGGTPTSVGGKWETLTIPMTNLPKDFGVVKTFNTFMKTPGDITLSIDQIAVTK